MNYLAQGIGFIAMGSMLLAFQNNNRKRILIFQSLAGVFYIVHFLLMSAFTGAAMNAVEVIRNIIFVKLVHPKHKKITALVFIAVFTISGILSWQNNWSLLPIFAMAFSNLAFINSDTKMIRFMFIPVFSAWLVYNISLLSIAGIISCVFDLVFLFIGIVRFDILKKEQKETKTIEV